MAKQKIGFGGSCHWCTEAIFQSLIGVAKVEQGWIASAPPNDTFSEAVIVHFDPEAIPLETLIEVHLHSHSCTAKHSMRGKYRSAVYLFDEAQSIIAAQTIKKMQPEFPSPIITQILPFGAFKLNEETYLDYYRKNPEKPFCVTYISPKLKSLSKRFGASMKPLS